MSLLFSRSRYLDFFGISAATNAAASCFATFPRSGTHQENDRDRPAASKIAGQPEMAVASLREIVLRFPPRAIIWSNTSPAWREDA
jgi:hypothetical protein